MLKKQDMKYFSKYARNNLALGGHGHRFCSAMQFSIYNYDLSSKTSVDDVDNEE